MGYLDIEIPKDKERPDYTHMERRAEILRAILKAGHPKSLNKSALARQFKVKRDAIYRDFRAIKKELLDGLGDDAEFITQTIYHKAIEAHAKSEDKNDLFKAAQLLKMWNDWLFDTGKIKKAPQELNIKQQSKELSLEEEFEEFKKLEKKQ